MSPVVEMKEVKGDFCGPIVLCPTAMFGPEIFVGEYCGGSVYMNCYRCVLVALALSYIPDVIPWGWPSSRTGGDEKRLSTFRDASGGSTQNKT